MATGLKFLPEMVTTSPASPLGGSIDSTTGVMVTSMGVLVMSLAVTVSGPVLPSGTSTESFVSDAWVTVPLMPLKETMFLFLSGSKLNPCIVRVLPGERVVEESSFMYGPTWNWSSLEATPSTNTFMVPVVAP